MLMTYVLIFLVSNAGNDNLYAKPTELIPVMSGVGAIQNIATKEDCLRMALLIQESFPQAITRCLEQPVRKKS